MSFNEGELLPNVDTEYKFVPTSWSPDLGTVPEEVKVNEVVYTKFTQDDTVIYTDIPLYGLYDPARPLNIDITYDTESGNAGDIDWILDYMATDDGAAPTGTFTNNRIVKTRTAGNKLEKVYFSAAFPAGVVTSDGTLTLRFGRLGQDASDTLNDNILVLNAVIYQGEA